MKKVFLILMSLIMVLLFSGCCLSHTWIEASCTAPRTCSKCGETEGEPVEHQWQEATCTAPSTCAGCGETRRVKRPHKFGKEEILNPNYVECTATFVKTCEQCGEQSQTEKELTKFVDQGVFLMTPEDFSERFTQALMDMPYLQDFDSTKYYRNAQSALNKLMSGDQYLSFVSDDTMSYDLTMYMAKRSNNGKIDIVGEFEMRDSEDYFMSNSQKNESGVLWKIQGKVKGKNSAIVAMLALYRAAAPEKWEEFIKRIELGPYVDPSYNLSTELTSFSMQRTQNVCYEITPKGNNTYEFTITAQ